MSAETQVELWRVETGIEELPADWERLAVAEVASIREIWTEHQARLKGTVQLQRFTERLSRQWAVETGIIENLYEIDRGVTQTLIEQGFQAALLERGSTNKPRDYVLRLLRDQQEALEGLFDFVSLRRVLSAGYIKELHAAMLRSQADVEAVDSQGRPLRVELIRGTWKSLPNYPSRGGVTYLYCPPEHVASEVDRMVAMHAEHERKRVPAEVEAAWLHHRFSQIHPFQDGNGRVARALASLVLIQQGLFPLVVTRDDKSAYLDALERADGGKLRPLVELFARLQRAQFRKMTAISESLLDESADVDEALAGLLGSIRTRTRAQQERIKEVFARAAALEAYLQARLGDLARELGPGLQQMAPGGDAVVDRSTAETDHFFRGQVMEIARNHLNYHPGSGPYRSWVRLKLGWSRNAQVVFTFHPAGASSSGVLACAPFLEFRDEEGDVEPRATLVNVAHEPFELFYNQPLSDIEASFRVWVDTVLATSLAEVQRNL